MTIVQTPAEVRHQRHPAQEPVMLRVRPARCGSLLLRVPSKALVAHLASRVPSIPAHILPAEGRAFCRCLGLRGCMAGVSVLQGVSVLPSRPRLRPGARAVRRDLLHALDARGGEGRVRDGRRRSRGRYERQGGCRLRHDCCRGHGAPLGTSLRQRRQVPRGARVRIQGARSQLRSSHHIEESLRTRTFWMERHILDGMHILDGTAHFGWNERVHRLGCQSGDTSLNGVSARRPPPTASSSSSALATSRSSKKSPPTSRRWERPTSTLAPPAAVSSNRVEILSLLLLATLSSNRVVMVSLFSRWRRRQR